MRIKSYPDKNYKSFFSSNSGVTMRWKFDKNAPMLKLDYPELYDVAINNLCRGGCRYCYISATHKGHNYDNICGKAEQFWGTLPEHDRPYQIAIGGAGEPTLHPDFAAFLKTVRNLGILPNYTTNGMHLTPELIAATEKYAGGVAVTCHPHLERFWVSAIDKLKNVTHLNLHIIPMSIADVDSFVEIFEEWRDVVEYFVILPYQAIGFGKPIDMQPVYSYLFDTVLANFKNTNQVAYGAYFYDELVKRPWLKTSLYEHGLFSAYLDMGGSMTLYNSSYEWSNPVRTNLLGM